MIAYIRRRLAEKTTWASIGIAVAAGAAVSAPYSWILIGCGIIGCLVPSPGPKDDAQ